MYSGGGRQFIFSGVALFAFRLGRFIVFSGVVYCVMSEPDVRAPPAYAINGVSEPGGDIFIFMALQCTWYMINKD